MRVERLETRGGKLAVEKETGKIKQVRGFGPEGELKVENVLRRHGEHKHRKNVRTIATVDNETWE
jgi:hypothetical protein